MSNQAAPCLERIHRRPPAFKNSINKGRSAAYCSRKHPTYTIVKSSAYLSDLSSFYLSYQIFGFDQEKKWGWLKLKKGKRGEVTSGLKVVHSPSGHNRV